MTYKGPLPGEKLEVEVIAVSKLGRPDRYLVYVEHPALGKGTFEIKALEEYDVRG